MAISHRSEAKSLWHILFQCSGSIWGSVLPYCLLNCSIMAAIEILAVYGVRIAFTPNGHGLMTLIISFLVMAKVNLSYERYMNSRHAIGHALSSLRELNQATMAFTSKGDDVAREWRTQTTLKILDVMDCTIRVIKDEEYSAHLARGVNDDYQSSDDPMVHVLALRLHLYRGSLAIQPELQLLERMKLFDILNEFVQHYRNLLKLASTPLPFPLVQMARTFLFLWTFTIPFVLRGVVDEAIVASLFVFFLTYGFIGLELVAMKLMSPFGDGINDLNIAGMREATVNGIENDMHLFGDNSSDSIGDRRLAFRRQKVGGPSPAARACDNSTSDPRVSHHLGNQQTGNSHSSSAIGSYAAYYSMTNN